MAPTAQIGILIEDLSKSASPNFRGLRPARYRDLWSATFAISQAVRMMRMAYNC